MHVWEFSSDLLIATPRQLLLSSPKLSSHWRKWNFCFMAFRRNSHFILRRMWNGIPITFSWTIRRAGKRKPIALVNYIWQIVILTASWIVPQYTPVTPARLVYCHRYKLIVNSFNETHYRIALHRVLVPQRANKKNVQQHRVKWIADRGSASMWQLPLFDLVHFATDKTTTCLMLRSWTWIYVFIYS